MNEPAAPSAGRYVPQMLIATTLVAVVPFAVSVSLRTFGVISSPWLAMALAILLSLAASTAGSAYWRKHGTAGEVLFSELLLWGWIRRRRQERDLAHATALLDLVGPGHEKTLSVERREQLLRQLADALDGQDAYLNGHSRRVARHATMIARGMGLPSAEVARVRAAAAIHDVGKLRTPKEILNKPGRLTDAEFEVIKRHPVDGAEMVTALGDPELTEIIRHHHERLDGAGYPDRLAGERIPVGARIIAVADTFDAITSLRPYRAAAPHQTAIDILRREAGTQLDPDAVRAFLAYYSGNRPTAVWAIVISAIRRVVACLNGDPAAAATIPAGKVAVATAAAAVIGVAAGTAPVRLIHPSRPAPVVASRHVSPPSNAPALPIPGTAGSAAQFATHPGPGPHVARTRGAHGAGASAAAASRRPNNRRPATHRVHSGSAGAATRATGGPRTSAGVSNPGTAPSSANTDSSNAGTGPSSAGTGSTSGSTSSSAGTVSNSSAGGSASRPTSTNPAGHTNHASSTGSSARSGQPPHATPPGHSGSSNGNGHSSASTTTTPTPTVPSTPAVPVTPGPSTPAGGQSNGNGNGNGNGNSSSQSSKSANPHANGNGNGNGNANEADADADQGE